jgi:hypothetical protein
MYIEELVLQAYLRREEEENLEETLVDHMAKQIAFQEDLRVLMEIEETLKYFKPETETKFVFNPLTKDTITQARKLHARFNLEKP